MHRLLFGVKKAHLGGVEFGKEQLSAIPCMTPARFDLLYTFMGKPPYVGLPYQFRSGEQAVIRRQLGLHPSTVSKMIKRLVEIGWLAKNLFGKRGRNNVIFATPKGIEMFELARRVVMRRRTVRHWFDRAFKPYRRGWVSAHREVCHAWEVLEHMAGAFERKATLLYELPYILDDNP